MKLLDRTDVNANAPIDEIIAAIELAFSAYERGTVQMPAKSYVDLPQYDGDFRSMPAYLETDHWDAAGIKWVNVHPQNSERFDLPTVMAVMIYSDPETGVPLAIIDGTALTMQRTGAAAAVATSRLSVEDATSLGIIGAGVQAYTQLDAISAIRPIEEVVVSDVDEVAVADFIDSFESEFKIRGGTPEEAAACDVLSTVTPVRDPIIDRSMLGSQTHVNAIGADAEGKHELADEILLDAKLVIDDYAQATHSGEINVPYREGVVTDDDIHGELGQIVAGTKLGRTTNDDVTVFDSTGLAIQDVATAHIVYQSANKNDDGYKFDLLGLSDS
jgi:alanine dehydrogenase